MAAASLASSVLAGLSAVRSWQEDFYRDLHQHPELSHQERRTAEKVSERLGRTGYRVHRGVGGTGVVGVLGDGDGPTVLLRADMDALPVREATGLPYASTATATDAGGTEVSVAHACEQTRRSVPTRTPTARPPTRAGWPRTSRSTIPPTSPRSSNPPSTPAPRLWSWPRWPGWPTD